MKKMIFRAALLAFLCALVVIFYYAHRTQEILIGFAGELTGVNADLGVQARNGVIMGIEEVNAAGGVNGKKIKVLTKNDEGAPETAIAVNKELIAAGVVAIIGHMTSSQSMAVMPLMNEAETILFSPTTSTPRLSGKKDYFFRLQADLRFSARFLGEFSFEKKKLRNLFIIKDLNNAKYTVPFETHFLKGFRQKEEQRIDTLNFSSLDPHNWSEEFHKRDMAAYDGIFVIASPISTAAIVQAFRKQDRKTPIISSSWGATRYLIQHGGRSVDGIYLTTTGVVDTEQDHYRRFFESYEHRFGRAPSFAANHGYHGAHILAEALAKTGGQKKGLRTALAEFENYRYFYHGKGLDPYGDAYAKSSIITIQNGRFVTILEKHSASPEEKNFPVSEGANRP